MLFQQFCNILQNESVYKNVDMNDFQRWLRSNFLTSTECLSESEIIQIVREKKNHEESQSENENENEERNENENENKKENEINNEINNYIKVSTSSVTQEITKTDAKLCLKYLLCYSQNKCYSQENITALYKIQEQLEKD